LSRRRFDEVLALLIGLNVSHSYRMAWLYRMLFSFALELASSREPQFAKGALSQR
jgi:hypothetical protein